MSSGSNEHLTKGASPDMDYEEYQKRRKALKNKKRQWSVGGFWGTGGAVRVYQARIEELDKLYEGEDYDEDRLHGRIPSPGPLGYKGRYFGIQFWVFVLLGWWTLGYANLRYHRRFKRKFPKEKRV